MACRKYARKRRERGDCMADATGGLQGMPKERAWNTGKGICKGSAEKRARGSRRSGKGSRLVGAKIARVQNGAGTW